MTTFVIESVIICAIFTFLCVLGVERGKKNLENVRLDYPDKIVERLFEIGLLEKKETPSYSERLKKKWPLLIAFGVIEGLVVKYANNASSFIQGFLISYALWTVVNWYDAFIIDCVWFCHSKRVIIEGTEDLRDAYRDYMFHIKGALRGMITGVFSSIIAGLFVLVMR